jgi:DNA ligase (NAD+)
VEIGAHIFCPNADCTPRIVAKLDHYASKNAMDIEGFSESTAELLVEKKGVKNFSDLYRLTESDLADLDGFKEKKIQNLLQAIEKSKGVKLDAFLHAIGIDGVGRVAAKDLAKRFKSVQNLYAATAEELTEMENVGEITARGIVAYFQSEENRAELQRLFDLGVAPVWEESVKADGKFAGKNVVLTGTLERYKRGEAQKLIEAEGGVCQSSVTAKTDLVIAGESAGSKLDKARKAGVKIIDESEFLRILEEE